ncbi:MAG TPA: MFS transporter, partial [Streptosporangiaceae bacterium]
RPALISLPGLPPALRHRNFALLWSGQTVSMLGDGIFSIALPLQALQVDRSPVGLSLVLMARVAPTACMLLVAGVVVDRIPRRMSMLGSDAARGLAVAVIAAGIAAGGLHLWALIAMAVVFGIADAFFLPSKLAIVPELLPGDLLVQGAALSTGSQQIARMLAGPALGGLVIAVAGLGAAFAADAASFAVSAAALLAVRGRPRPARTGRSMLAEAREGLRYCRSQRWLWITIAAVGVANLVAYGPLPLLVPLLVKNVLRGGPVALGLVTASSGTGGVIASVIAGRLGAPRRQMTVIWFSWGLAGTAVAGLGLAPTAWAACVLVAFSWAMVMYGTVLWNSLMQSRVPASLLGRASSVEWLLSYAGTPVGIVAAGAVAGAAGPRAVLVAGGCLAALMALVLVVPGVRESGHQEEPPAPATGAQA